MHTRFALSGLTLWAVLSSCGGKAPPESALTNPPSEKTAAPAGHTEREYVDIPLDQQKVNRFEFAKAEVRTGARVLTTTGSILPNEARVAKVRPLSRGRVMAVRVRVGDRVAKNQELLTYDNIELGETIQSYMRAQSLVTQAKTNAEVAQKAYERARDLEARGAVSRAELERRHADFKNAVASIDVQATELTQADEKLHRFGLTEGEITGLMSERSAEHHRGHAAAILRAPFDGVLLRVTAAEGDIVEAGQDAFAIVDTSTVWVQADVYAQDLAAIREGSAAVVRVDTYPGEAFSGRVTHIGDAVNPETRATRVRVEVPNPARRLKLDMFATVELPARGEHSALMIPASAVQDLSDELAVFIPVSPTRFLLQAVLIGPESRGWVEVTKGVKAGDTVVTRGSFTLKSEHLRTETSEGHHH